MEKFTTIGHHTCEDDSPENLKKNAPFRGKTEHSFLGSGYYLWEDHIEYAHHWGLIRYKNKRKDYAICKWQIECNWPNFLDLAGRTQDMKRLKEVVKIVSTDSTMRKWSVGKIIEFWRRSSHLKPDYLPSFPYKLIRAHHKDAKRDLVQEHKFSSKEDEWSMLDLNPCNILCVIDKNGILLDPVDIVHRSSTVHK